MTSPPALVRESERLAVLHDLRDALAEVWSGAEVRDAEALLDHLGDRLLQVVREVRV